MVVAADGERDRLRVGPLVVAEAADQPFRPLFQLADLGVARWRRAATQAGRDRLADLGDLDQRLGAAGPGSRRRRRAAWIGSGRSSSRSRSLTYCGDLLTRSASCFFESLPELQDRLEGVRFLDRVEVLAVQVLVDGQLDRGLAVVADR